MMADIIDIAQDLQEQAMAKLLADQQAVAERQPALQPVGYCHNPLCGDDLDGDRLFCGPDCAREYERMEKR